MLDRVERLGIVGHQDKEFLVGAPLGVEFRIKVTKVLGHQSAFDKTLLSGVQDSVDSGSNKDDEGETDQSVVSVVNADGSGVRDEA